MRDGVTFERGKTLTYTTMYPTLLITPEFGHRNDFVWIERIICQWDAEPVGKGDEFGFVRDSAHNERCDELEEENEKLRGLVRDMWDVALHPETFGDGSYLLGRMRDLGIEVG